MSYEDDPGSEHLADQPMDDPYEKRSGQASYRVTPHRNGWVVEKRVSGSLPAIWNLAESCVWSTNELAQQRAVALSLGAVPEFSESDILKSAPRESSDAYGDPWVPFEQATVLPVELPPGTVIGFTKRYTEDGAGYSFAAIHIVPLGWYMTGPKYSGHPVDWETLLDFIGGPDDWAAVGVVTGWTPMMGSPSAEGYPR